MMTLLKDVYSVDIRFMFTADNRFTDISLWVHRSILSKHQVFRNLIEHAFAAQSGSGKGGSEFSPLTLNADKVSLPTFCALVMYIYTGKIERMVDPSKFAISTRHTLPAVLDTANEARTPAAGNVKTRVCLGASGPFPGLTSSLPPMFIISRPCTHIVGER